MRRNPAGKFLNRLADGMAGGIFAFLSPPRCRACRAPLFDHANPYLCPECAGGIRWIGGGACRGCGFPAGPGATHARDCIRCRGKKLNLTAALAVARYTHGARNLVRAFKYGGETELARPIAALMAERLRGADFAEKVDVIVPVPLHARRRRARGFDQARLLAARVSERAGIPWDGGLLRRVVHSTPQASLHREERLRNMTGAFAADDGSLSGRRVLLLDDVLTTGATMADSSRACREAGATRVYALVFAR